MCFRLLLASTDRRGSPLTLICFYCRTGRRDLSGMLNDGMNSLARWGDFPGGHNLSLNPDDYGYCRMYSATFTDYFSQAVIDFTLGHRTLSVFSEFMSNMTSTDPRELFRLSKVRAIAIETCAALVVPEGEGEIKGGWTVFSPVRLGVRVSAVFEEKVLLVVSDLFFSFMFFCVAMMDILCARFDCRHHGRFTSS